ncbi:MAG: FHA domain-containing protein, partial [Lachnospiraceae bacterium]|nr:FHA domain-containing protein [Lachnospiraceae bacterium]
MNYDANNLPLGVVTITTGELRGKKFYIRDGQTIVIGRSQDADIILPISYSHVSRHHCSITYDGIHKMFFVVDTSANGVLNSEGHHLKSQANLKNGTVLWMGNSDCIITLSAEQEVQANPIRETGNVPPVYPLNQSGYAYKQVEHSPDRGESSRRNDRRHEKSMSSRRSVGIILAAVFITIVVSVGLIYRLQSSISDIPVEALLPTGDFAKDVEPVEVTEMSEDEMEEKKQSAHNHEEAPDEVLLVNNAREFYYYSALTDKEQMLYDAIMRVVQDPANEDNVIMYESDINPNSDEFADQYNKVLFCVLYDHPETFWLYNNHETKIEVGTMGTADDNIVYLWLQQPYVNYEQEITAFNHAAEEFLADIDLTASDSEIALQIHDKLIELVTYDTDVVDQSDGSDFAHTAYGALVENSRGMEHYAVCDGYSLAYEYLLQQAGIEASVIIGDA